jgi:hypothetical protein
VYYMDNETPTYMMHVPMIVKPQISFPPLCRVCQAKLSNPTSWTTGGDSELHLVSLFSPRSKAAKKENEGLVNRNPGVFES